MALSFVISEIKRDIGIGKIIGIFPYQYRRVTDTQTDRHLATDKPRLCRPSRGKNRDFIPICKRYCHRYN